MNKNVPFIWRVNYRNDVTPPEKVLEEGGGGGVRTFGWYVR